MRAKNLKGVFTLSTNMLGWIVSLTIFVVILMILFGFMFEFQTIPTEPVEKSTACDVAFMISLWDEATVRPNIFNKDFLDTWKESSDSASDPTKQDTSNILFEKLSQDFFVPDQDIYLEISTPGKDTYKLYIPEESKSVFSACARPTYTTTEPVPDWTLNDFFRTGDYFEQKGEYERYKKDMTSYNAILAECQLPSFVADPDEKKAEPASVKVALTSNLATRLRDGIYRVGVKGEKSAYYPLGSYPEGCIVNEGAVKISEKKPSAVFESLDLIKRIIIGILDPSGIQSAIANIFGGGAKMAKDFYEDNKIVASCGFNWNYQRTCQITCKNADAVETSDKGQITVSCDGNKMTCPEGKLDRNTQPKTYICNSPECTSSDLGLNKLTVHSMKDSLDCPLMTRIPNYIAEESKLSDKLCTPKTAFTRVWLPKGDFSNYQYFLKVESARSSWEETDEISFCQNRCKEYHPWWWVGDGNTKDCKEICAEMSKETKDGKKDPKEFCANWPTLDKNRGKSYDAMKTNCNFARELIHLYRNLPEDAINIRYIVVSSDKLKEKSFAELTEDDYYTTDSACSTWKSLCDLAKEKQAGSTSEPACCASAQDCNGLDCIAGQCEKCSADYWGFCSPSYLDYPVSLGLDSKENGLFKCQNVYNQAYPSNTRMNECLPALKVGAFRIVDEKDKTKDEKLELDEVKQAMSLDCKIDKNKDAKVRWEIDASGLCCPQGDPLLDKDGNEVKDDEGNIVKICNNPPDYCLNMKFWPNLDSTKTAELLPRQYFYEKGGKTEKSITSKDYVYEITQQVCRGDKPFNNAPVAFITANYPVRGKTFQYSLEGSEIIIS